MPNVQVLEFCRYHVRSTFPRSQIPTVSIWYMCADTRRCSGWDGEDHQWGVNFRVTMEAEQESESALSSPDTVERKTNRPWH